MNSNSTLTLSESEVKQLNDRHIGSVDKWFRMFMGLASKVTKVQNNVIHLQVVYSNNVEQPTAETVARSWLKSPNNSILLQADAIVVTEYKDKGKPGDVLIFEEGIPGGKAAESLGMDEPHHFGNTKRFINRHILMVDSLLRE